MELIREINIIDDKKMSRRLNIISFILVVFLYMLFEIIVNVTVGTDREGLGISGMLLGLVLLFLLLILHELIHGVFMKLFQPEAKVRFGFKNGMAYATSPNSYYSRNKFLWISAAPFVFITPLLVVLFTSGLLSRELFVFLISIHSAGCVGDFYYIYLLSKSSKKIKVEDTEKGINLYENK